MFRGELAVRFPDTGCLILNSLAPHSADSGCRWTADNLVQAEALAAVEPAGEVDIIGVMPGRRNFDEAAAHTPFAQRRSMCGPASATLFVPVSARVTRSCSRKIASARVTPASPPAASA